MNAGAPRNAMRQQAMFLSDVHLSAAHPETVLAFLGFLDEQVAGRTERLFVLGDLFEYWAGDDDLDAPFNRSVVDALRKIADGGTRLWFIAGNRDFLIGERFANAARVTLLPDPYRVVIGSTSLLLSHGDLLCTDDVDYQRFRAMVRQAEWRRAFLARPLAERRAIIADMRMQSEEAKRDKPAEIMDVNATAVAQAFETSGELLLIHGHTHRPAHHVVDLDARRCQRWVLPDWDAEAAPPRGGALVLNHGVLRPIDIAGRPDNPDNP